MRILTIVFLVRYRPTVAVFIAKISFPENLIQKIVEGAGDTFLDIPSVIIVIDIRETF
jgi:hypothetical protein